MSEIFEELLQRELNPLGIFPDKRQVWQFTRYASLLAEWNEKMNLTAVTGEEEIIRRHFADSLTPLKALPDFEKFSAGKRLIDVGTGAGFPGIPLKIVYPDLSVTLLDSQEKRVSFLRLTVSELDLQDVTIVHGRAEDCGHDVLLRGQFDLAVSRAVAPLRTLLEYGLPFVKPGGAFVVYKSARIDEELEKSENALAILGGRVERKEKFTQDGVKRSLLLIRKEKETPDKYPRKAGKPKHSPL